MSVTAADFAGAACGCLYEKEQERSFRDCLYFYIDGRILFERYCYGESAGLVFSSWADGFDPDGAVQWGPEPSYEGHRAVLPKRLTDVQEDGRALQFDGLRRRYVRVQELESDREHGYSKWKLFWIKRRKKQ